MRSHSVPGPFARHYAFQRLIKRVAEVCRRGGRNSQAGAGDDLGAVGGIVDDRPEGEGDNPVEFTSFGNQVRENHLNVIGVGDRQVDAGKPHFLSGTDDYTSFLNHQNALLWCGDDGIVYPLVEGVQKAEAA